MTSAPSDSQNHASRRFNAVLDLIQRDAELISLHDMNESFRAQLDSIIQRRSLTVAVFGRVKAGKSTFVNALLGQDISPRAVSAMTAVPIRFRSASTERVTAVWRDGRNESMETESLKSWMSTLRASSEQSSRPAELVIEVAGSVLGSMPDAEILDTPGVGGWTEHESATVYELLSKAVVAILVYKHDDAIGVDFIKIIDVVAKRSGVLLLSVCNRDPNLRSYETNSILEFRESREQQRRQLERICADDTDVDCLAAMKGKIAGDEGLIAESRLRDFEKKLKLTLGSRGRLLLRQRIAEAVSLLRTMKMYADARRTEVLPRVEEINQGIGQSDSDAEALKQMALAASTLVRKYEEEWGPVPSALLSGLGGAAIGGAVGAVLFWTGLATAVPFVAMPAAILAVLAAGGGAASSDKKRSLHDLQLQLQQLFTLCDSERIKAWGIDKNLKQRLRDVRSTTLVPVLQEFIEDVENKRQLLAEEAQRSRHYQVYELYESIAPRLEAYESELIRLDEDLVATF